MTDSESPKHIIVVGCLVRAPNGDVLLVRHHERGWELPQGRVEEGESLLDALHREVMEEAGIVVEQVRLAAVWSKLSPPSAVIHLFLARYRNGELRAGDECPEVGWFPTGEARTMVSHPVNLDRLNVLLDFTGTVVYRSYSSKPYRIDREEPLTGSI